MAESLNACPRDILGNHRGFSLISRVKAVFLWCHMRSGGRTASEELATMPNNADAYLFYRTYFASPKRGDGGPK